MDGQDPTPRPRVIRRQDGRLSLSRQRVPLKSDEVPRKYDEFETEFFEDVLKQAPCDEDSLIVLGHAYTRRGEYEKGLEIDRRLARLRPEDPIVFYNLACSFSLLGRVDDAYDALEQSVRRGYHDMGHMLEDPDLENLRRDDRFEAFCGRMKLLGPGASGADS